MLHPEAKIPQMNINFEIIDQAGKYYKIQKISSLNEPALREDNCFELMFHVILDNYPPEKTS